VTSRPRTSADRITTRDARLLRLIAEHRVLTTAQITAALFAHDANARRRISVLREAGLIETFTPAIPSRQPMHCVVTARGLRLLGSSDHAVAGVRSARSDAALAAALRPDLGHLLGVNSFFCRLMAQARRQPGRALEAWLSEWSTALRFPGRVRPDGFGRWRDGDVWCEFFLEYDTGTEPLHRLVGKLAGYAELAYAADVCSPVLFWLLTPGREQHLHRLLREAGRGVPTATAVGDPAVADVAGPIWRATFTGGRAVLADLGPMAADSKGVPHRSHTL
jgi:hypothetical protein